MHAQGTIVLFHAQQGLLAAMSSVAVNLTPFDACVIYRSSLSRSVCQLQTPWDKIVSVTLLLQTGVKPRCLCHAECIHSVAVDTGKHAESTTYQALTPHAELLLMRVLAQPATAANGFNIEKLDNENNLFNVFT